ncbi:hypothetical protein SMACR_00296 [Sordaria macrospora]|uniref:WGS project CABT00000000 data, contig 2.1 n=2 Tax=Sordaria macrospora TaxID=5147 RepID=F7VKQ2_SORMK|nr:uncharacterized protein SMAC_00296 [Sordaria macrospora k-hell]KAA8636868.1 hypothetical protein SMACR_00296 [Sordaria macrospora]KAH7634151.1 hypothetical protein B0T09DRAFT_339 [Sordaria sp. MPI-SDFR-AT-0083]WPJ59041.1 hypothetical protein SMAC4_00296 [Sordaria macrospora]CCC06079.1 unnamed protein product [Sordaria macrospora k-hell]
MKASIVLVSFLGLVSGMVLPGIRLSPSGAKPQSRSLFRRDDKLDYRYAPQACRAILTTCRVSSDCCSGMKCVSADGESVCTPSD